MVVAYSYKRINIPLSGLGSNNGGLPGGSTGVEILVREIMWPGKATQ